MESATFILSAFNLQPLSDALPTGDTAAMCNHVTRRLFEFLKDEDEFHLHVQHGKEQEHLIPTGAPSFTLRFDAWVEGPARFIRPDDWSGKSELPLPADASPVFQFVCRLAPDRSADLWVRISHVAADGVPAQEMMTRLEQAWGMKMPVVFPSAKEFQPHTLPRRSPGRPGTVEVQTFIDFAPLLAWRKRENEKLAEPMTLSAAVLWWLARHPRFSGLHLGTTVEVPALNGLNRGVGVIVTRPANYFARPEGLRDYVRDFNRELALTKKRKSRGCKVLDAAAFLSPALERALLIPALEQGKSAFGSVGLTILKNARVFGAPLGDAGHQNGFIAIGAVSTPCSNGIQVGCVCVKGSEHQIANYASILRAFWGWLNHPLAPEGSIPSSSGLPRHKVLKIQ